MAHLAVNFTNHRQENLSWCWAAVASNVYNSFGPTDAKSQCDVARLVKQGCAVPQLGDLGNALTALGISSPPETQRVKFFETILNQLGQHAPVGAEIGFADGPHHFVAIVGADDVLKHVWIADPFPGGDAVEVPFDVFCDSYAFAANDLGPGEKDGRVTALFPVHKP